MANVCATQKTANPLGLVCASSLRALFGVANTNTRERDEDDDNDDDDYEEEEEEEEDDYYYYNDDDDEMLCDRMPNSCLHRSLMHTVK